MCPAYNKAISRAALQLQLHRTELLNSPTSVKFSTCNQRLSIIPTPLVPFYFFPSSCHSMSFAGHTEGSARVRVYPRFLGYGGSHGSSYGYASTQADDDDSPYVDGPGWLRATQACGPTASDLFQRRIVMCSSVSTMMNTPLVSPVALLAYSSFSLSSSVSVSNPSYAEPGMKAPRLDELDPCLDIRPAHACRVRPSQRVLDGLRLQHRNRSLARHNQRQAPAGILRDDASMRQPPTSDNNNNDQHDHEHAHDPVIGSFLLPLQRRPMLMAVHPTRGVKRIKSIMPEGWTSWKVLSRPCCIPLVALRVYRTYGGGALIELLQRAISVALWGW
jgi:hypothetical protein